MALLSQLKARETILFIINADWYFDLHWLNRALFLRDNGYDIHVATSFNDENFVKKFTALGFHCHSVFLKRRSLNPSDDVRTCYAFYKVYKKVNPSFVHCVTIKPNLYGGLVAAMLKKKIVFTIPGLGTVFSSKQFRFKFMRLFVSYAYKLIAKTTRSIFVFENHDDYNFFVTKKIIHKSQGIVINGAGVNTEQFPYFELTGSNTLLFAARMLKDKGLFDLLEAVKNLRNRGQNVTLNVAGLLDTESDDAISEEQLCQLHEDGVINWLGACDNMPEQIRQSAVVCLPTTYGEGVPRILIEAASCGRAIVTTDVSGCREIALDGYNAKLVYPGDVEALTQALSELLTNRQTLLEYGRNGRQLVIDKFSDDIVLRSTLGLYTQFV
ncbi:glycosyltransferase family 4 protein [Serratia rubidaea]|uniref:glycosyltransferase family 4 protein n=1 Tax=Serratia rubidaea TaxID=61652 RepID=UPI001BAE98AD|nr:glycosyltransferase family 4 protein [Serratia rubidaea]MBS0972387.1 glycosyltransferase family 4 protein [Serratia rubidaea]